MPDNDDQDKAEKLAAARKKVTQMKKKAAAKGQPSKKKDDASATADADTETTETTLDEKVEESPKKQQSSPKDSKSKATSPSLHTRQPSASQQSRIRSTSFRASGPGASTSPPLRSPTAIAFGAPANTPLSPSEEAADIYRKQASRIEELEKQVRQLEAQAAKLPKLEEEVEELRESSSDANASVASLKEKAREADDLKAEVASLKRQNAQLQSQVQKRSGRRESVAGGNGDDDNNGGSTRLRAELESKTATIDALELEISALNSRATSSAKNADEQTARVTELEAELRKTQDSAELATQELQDLRTNLARQQEEAEGDKKKSQQPDSAALSRRVAQLEAELASAQRAAALANTRADNLDKKVATLTTLHRETETRRAQAQSDSSKHERELKELRSRIGDVRTENDRLRDEATRRKKLEAEGDSAGLEELEEEERQRLASRVRELETEVFELRRGVWRERRKELQPGLNIPDEEILSTSAGSFDEVDLSASYHNGNGRRQNGLNDGASNRQTSTFTDVINSGIRAFANEPYSPNAPRPAGAKTRKQSLGQLLDEFDDEEDFNFDEEGFRKAQEEEAAARLERVREIKRGLKKWEGWGMDLADLRAGMGGVFDV